MSISNEIGASAAKDQGAFVSIHPDAVNFVKRYLAENDLHTKHEVASAVVNPCPEGKQDPYQCPHIQRS